MSQTPEQFIPILKPISPPRPKHRSHRSITETSFSKIHRPGHIPHPHIHRHHARDSKAQEVRSNPNLVLNSWASEGSKGEITAPPNSENPSRRESGQGIIGENEALEEKRVVKEEEVQAEKERGILRAVELRNALTDLNTLSNNTAAKLDNAYWRVLEKVSELQHTISAMKELAVMTKQLDKNFKHDSHEIVMEVETALDGFHDFSAQQARIEDLSERVKKGRTSIKELGDKVDLIKERVNGWDKAGEAWHERSRKRIRMLWMVFTVCGAVCLAVVVFQYTPAKTNGPGVLRGLSLSSDGMNHEGGNESFSLRREAVAIKKKIEAKTEKQQEMDQDARLKVFDEL